MFNKAYKSCRLVSVVVWEIRLRTELGREERKSSVPSPKTRIGVSGSGLGEAISPGSPAMEEVAGT